MSFPLRERIRPCVVGVLLAVLGWGSLSGGAAAAAIDLADATIVVRSGNLPPGEAKAATVLAEEVAARTGLAWEISNRWPASGPVIALGSRERGRWSSRPPRHLLGDGPGAEAEGYVIHTAEDRGRTVLWLVGADGPGTLFAAGHLLRQLEWHGDGRAGLAAPLEAATAPAYPIRGHQLGYRAHSNTYDAWDDVRYEQYIRELALFGTNAIEQIAFQDDRESPHFRLDRRTMNRRLSEICADYELQYWVWTPAEDLSDPETYAKHIAEHEELYADCPRLDGVFFPGGDPGNNPPELVLPFIEDLAVRLEKRHPDARFWISLQGFSDEAAEFVYQYVDDHEPAWLGGLVAGPGSPPIVESRARLHPDFGLRHYPDITHTVRCQYPTPWWDPAFNVTLGREPTNPEPVRYGHIHNWFAPYTVGSISYSDGVNDDLNKVVWSRLGWDPDERIPDILRDYGRVFYGAEVALEAADAIQALEQNWQGPLSTNGAVEGTLALWERLDARVHRSEDNWRWLLHLQRAHYDAYTRTRLLYEQALEEEAYALLRDQAPRDPDAAMAAARAVLERAESEPVRPDQYEAIVAMGDRLHELIGIQQSMERHQSSGTQRGCVLDLIHYPLFNRWWIEDEFEAIAELDDRAEKTERLLLIAHWERPGPGSFYDDIGNVGNMPRRIEGESVQTDPLLARNPNTGFMWWDGGYSRTRPSWQSYLSRTLGLRYHGLDPTAGYTLRATGYGEPIVMANGAALARHEAGRAEIGEFMHFTVPAEAYADGTLVVTWEQPDESHLNWREHSRLTEVWLLRDED